MSVANNLQLIHQSIAASAKKVGRKPEDIKLIAVSKTRAVEEVKSVIDLGVNVFGENTIQDAMTKIPVIGTEATEWHFIGHLQSKKAKNIPGYFDWIHTIDSIHLAEKISSAMLKNNAKRDINCLIQVNVSGEASKSGITVSELISFVNTLMKLELPCIQWRGLMTIGVNNKMDESRAVFSKLRQCRNQCVEEFSLDNFDQLSMGMSDDFQVAIEEGATMVRLGTSIFGDR